MSIDQAKVSLLLLKVAVLAMLISFPHGNPAVAQELAWKLKAGDKFEVTLTQQKLAQTSVDKRFVKNTSHTSIRQHWDVDSIDERGNFRVKQFIKSIKLSVENPELPSQALSVDTDSDAKVSKESTKVLNQIRPLIDLELLVTISPRGEILGVSYSDEVKKALQELPGSLGLQSLFTGEGFKELLGSAAIVFPEKVLQPGEKWATEDSVINPLGEFKRTREYRLVEIEKNDAQQIAVIELKTNIEPKVANAKSGKLNSFTETGELRLDLIKGFVQSSKTTSITDAETNYMEIVVQTRIENINTVVIGSR